MSTPRLVLPVPSSSGLRRSFSAVFGLSAFVVGVALVVTAGWALLRGPF